MTRFSFLRIATLAALAACLSAVIPAQTLASMSGVQWLDQVQRDRKSSDVPVWISAEVQSVNPNAGEVTIAHGPIPRVQMPAMTMTFAVKDAAHLRTMKRGDRIDFQAANEGGIVRIINVRMLH